MKEKLIYVQSVKDTFNSISSVANQKKFRHIDCNRRPIRIKLDFMENVGKVVSNKLKIPCTFFQTIPTKKFLELESFGKLTKEIEETERTISCL